MYLQRFYFESLYLKTKLLNGYSQIAQSKTQPFSKSFCLLALTIYLQQNNCHKNLINTHYLLNT